MGAVGDRLAHLSLRRPFSRKINVSPADILSEAGSARFLETYGRLAPRFPLVNSIRFLIQTFRRDYPAAEVVIRDILNEADLGAYRDLFRRSDLRKLTLGCFREFVKNNRNALPPPMAQRLFEFSYALDPECRRIHDRGAGGKDRPAPVSPAGFAYAPRPPAGLKLAFYGRKRHFDARSRAHDAIYRFTTAFAASGADCPFVDPSVEDFEVQRCDLALVDDSYVFRKEPKRKREFLERVRGAARRVGLLELDPWQPSLADRIEGNRDLYDFIWTMAPSLAREGRIHGLKACLIPFPVGFAPLFEEARTARARLRQRDVKFCGAIEDYNFHRYYWMLLGAQMRNPFAFEISSHEDDSLSVRDSLGRYLERLGSSYAALSFTMRADGRRLVVGRTFDCIRLGQLLVQEACPDMPFYFRPGVHYLEFADARELDDLCGRIEARVDFEGVRAAGQRHFDSFYSDSAVARHVATFL